MVNTIQSTMILRWDAAPYNTLCLQFWWNMVPLDSVCHEEYGNINENGVPVSYNLNSSPVGICYLRTSHVVTTLTWEYSSTFWSLVLRLQNWKTKFWITCELMLAHIVLFIVLLQKYGLQVQEQLEESCCGAFFHFFNGCHFHLFEC